MALHPRDTEVAAVFYVEGINSILITGGSYG